MTKTCIVCSSNDGKYKCPTCSASYCSVNCCKQHRKENCTPKQDAPGPSGINVNPESKILYPTPDTVATERLEQLQENKDLKDILANPHLRQLLQAVNESEDAEKSMAKMMQEPIFVEFANACLATVEKND